MIFGKSKESKEMDKQIQISNMIFNPKRRFAYLWVTLKDGRKIWFEEYYAYARGGVDDNNNLFLWYHRDGITPMFDYYLDKSDDYVSLVKASNTIGFTGKIQSREQLKEEIKEELIAKGILYEEAGKE